MHKLFDEVNDAVRDNVDEVAERAMPLGGNLRYGHDRRGSQEPEAVPRDRRGLPEHVEALFSTLATFGRATRKGIDDTNGFGDLDTADLFTEVSRGIDK